MNKISFTIILMAGLLLISCNDYLDVTPKDKQTADQLYATKAGYYTALNGIYDGMASDNLYGKYMTWHAADIIAARYSTTSMSTTYQQLAADNYGYSTVSPIFASIWSKAYSLILADNILIDRVDANGGKLTADEASIMKGELLAIRAYLHLDMLRLFGPSPYQVDSTALSIPYNESSNVTTLDLLPFSTVITKIVRDLDEAETLLQNDPVRTSGPMMSSSETESVQLRYRSFRLNYYAVIALKARAYVWAGQASEALAQAKRLIEDNTVVKFFPAVDPNKLLANNTNPDRVFSTEVLFGIYDKDHDEVYDDYFSSSAPSTQRLMPYNTFVTGGQYSLFKHLLLGAENNDYRFQSQWEPASGTGMSGYTLCKYKAISKPDPNDDKSEYYYSRMIPLIRLQEMYLIAAECEPVTADQAKWYNIARSRRGCAIAAEFAPYISTYFDYGYKPILLSQEYMREFYGEGQIFYWLKRTCFQPGYPAGMVTPYDNGAGLSMATLNVRPPLPEGEMK